MLLFVILDASSKPRSCVASRRWSLAETTGKRSLRYWWEWKTDLCGSKQMLTSQSRSWLDCPVAATLDSRSSRKSMPLSPFLVPIVFSPSSLPSFCLLTLFSFF